MFGEVLDFSYQWVNRKESWKLYGVLVAIPLTFLLLTLLAALFIGGREIALAMFLGKKYLPLPGADLGAMAFLINMVALLIVVIILGIIRFLLVTYFEAKVGLSALGQKGLTLAEWNAGRLVRYILLGIAHGLAVLFSVYELRLLAVLILTGVLMGLAFAAGGIVALFFIAVFFLALLISVIYNSTRLCLSAPIFLHKNPGIIASLEDSWKLSKGKVVDIFVTRLLLGIAWFLLILAISVPVYLVAFGEKLFLGFSVVANLLAMFIAPVSIFASYYIIVGVYYELWKKKSKGMGLKRKVLLAKQVKRI